MRQVVKLDMLGGRASQWAGKVVALRRTKGLQAAAAAIESGEGQRIWDEYRSAIVGMQREQMRSLELQRVNAAQRLRGSKIALVLGTLLGLLIAAAAGLSAWREASRRGVAERALRDSDEQDLMLVQGIQDYAVLKLNALGDVVSWNPRAEKMTGYSYEEVMGQSFSFLFLPEDIELGRPQEMLRAAAQDLVDEQSVVFVRKDGSRFQVRTTLTALRNSGGDLRGFSLVSCDLSESAHSEARYRGLLEAAPDAMIVINSAEEIVLLNVQAEKQFGYSRDELIGQQVKNIIPQGFAERLIADGTRTAAEALAQQIGTGIELSGRRKDGSDFPIEIMLSPLDGAEGILVTAAIRDITERKLRENDLSRLAAVVESSYDAIVSLSPQGIILTWNHGAERIFGYSAEEAIAKSILLLSPSGQPVAGEELLEMIKRADTVERFETVRTKKDGTRIDVALTLSPIKDADGCVVGVSSVARDITESRHLEEMFRQAQRMEAVGQLAGGVAHDFNNLLGVILGYTGLLLDRMSVDDPQRKDIEQVEKAGNRAALLTRQLLAFSRKQVLQPKVLDLNAVVAGAEKLLQRLIGEDVELLVRLAPGLGQVKADPGQLEQIIMNLAVNARDAMPSGGKLTIETSNVNLDETYAIQHYSTLPGPHVMLAVTDNGCGMDSKTKAHIFEPFFTTKEFGKGTGLGLSTVFGIVQQSGGYLWVYSEPGIGTSFKIYLPCVGSPAASDVPADSAEPAARGFNTILIVEDEADLLEVTHRSLAEVGYSIIAAHSPAEAIVLSGNHPGPIHLMVTDVIMPGMSGGQLATHLCALRPEMKVLFVSGYTDDTIVRHGVLEPGLAFLQKPFSPKTLTRKVREVLASTGAVAEHVT